MKSLSLPSLFFVVVFAPSLLLFSVPTAEAAADAASRSSFWWDELKKGVRCTPKILLSAAYDEIARSTQNPQNSLLHLPEWSLKTELRPDLFLLYNQFDITLKPRAQAGWRQRENSTADTDADWSVLEWHIKARASDTVFFSWGWENLQWGPSYMASPSNPFFYDNGRLSPREEIEGLDIARLVWVLDEKLTISLIAGSGKGADDDIRDFEQKYAAKLDYTAAGYYGSLVASTKKDEQIQLGGFAGVTASDALLLYLEGAVHNGTPTYFPVAASSPFDLTLTSNRQDDGIEGRLLGGASYTLESGSTFVAEYLYNSAGYSDAQAELFHKLRAEAAAAYTAGGPVALPAAKQLRLAVDPGFGFMRKHYLLFQFRKSEIFDMVDITLSWLQNLDDGSSRLLPAIDIALWDHAAVFLHGVVNRGEAETEYTALYRFQIVTGLEFTF